MGWTIESALDHKLLSHKFKFLSEYRFVLGELSPMITIRIYKQADMENYWFQQSHFIKTPTQMGPYQTNRQYEDSEAYALHRAVHSLTQYYDEAVGQGHTPNDSWLVPNDSFY
jgi:hypothetical protein